MTDDRGLKLWRRMTSRDTRHEYDVSCYWEELDNSADEVERQQAKLNIAIEALQISVIYTQKLAGALIAHNKFFDFNKALNEAKEELIEMTVEK